VPSLFFGRFGVEVFCGALPPGMIKRTSQVVDGIANNERPVTHLADTAYDGPVIRLVLADHGDAVDVRVTGKRTPTRNWSMCAFARSSLAHALPSETSIRYVRGCFRRITMASLLGRRGVGVVA
jgi:hypothetical protein